MFDKLARLPRVAATAFRNGRRRSKRKKFFNRLAWDEGQFRLRDLLFEIQVEGSDNTQLPQDRFSFFKAKWAIDDFASFWRTQPGFDAKHIVEIGIWDGGSTAFWNELFQPNKLVALDFLSRGDSPYFRRYVASRRLQHRVKTYWGVDQADALTVRRIVRTEFGSEPLDLVIDDASHLYEQTKASFETLFPLLRPGGLYIIEDWDWACWTLPEGHYLNRHRPLIDLVGRLVEVTGTKERLNPVLGDPKMQGLKKLIEALTVRSTFVAIERGNASAAELNDTKLEAYVAGRAKERAA
jgi:predicted O-methyltransferase YrrM